MAIKLRLFLVIMIGLFAVPGLIAGTGAPASGSGLWISSVHADTLPSFSVDPSSLDFGVLFISSTAVETVTVSNISAKALFISSVTVDSGEFSVSPANAVVPPGGDWQFFVEFAPTFAGAQSGNVHFVHNGSTSPDLLPLAGIGTPTTAAGESTPLPKKFALKGNYPNPFNPATRIAFDVPKQTTVSLIVYNALGAEVAEILSNVPYEPGSHEISFNAENLATGVYFYRLRTPEFNSIRKMVLMK